jgi:hypothetical protein
MISCDPAKALGASFLYRGTSTTCSKSKNAPTPVRVTGRLVNSPSPESCSIRRLGSPARIVNGPVVVARLHPWCHASDGKNDPPESKSSYWIELAACEKTVLALEPISRTVPTTMTRITASITAYSAMS